MRSALALGLPWFSRATDTARLSGGRATQRTHYASAAVTGASVLITYLSACSENPQDVGDVVTSVQVTPSSVSLIALGETAQLSAGARNAGGGAIAGKTFTWTSSDENVASVDAAGLVTSVTNGSATISASTDGVSGSATVTVSIDLVTIDLGTLGGDSSNAYNVNDAGQIVGTSTTSSGDIHAFIWQNGVMTDLGTLGGSTSRPTTILPSSPLSEAGHVIGVSAIAGDTEWRAFLWHDGVMTDLGTLGGLSVSGSAVTEARAVNSSGQVVGGSLNTGNAEQHAFLWQDGVMTDLGTLGGSFGIATAMNEAGQIAGRATNQDSEYRIFLWENETDGMIDLGSLAPGQQFNFAVAYDLNEAGQMIGRTSTSAGISEQHAFLWDNGSMTDLGTLGGDGNRASNALALNEVGKVVGRSYTTGNAEQHAFSWQNGVMTDLGTLGGTNSAAHAVNDRGQIVGYSYIAGGVEARPVLWEDGDMIELETLGGTAGTARDINELGWIVGYSQNAAGEYRATLWRPRTPADVARQAVWDQPSIP